MDAGFQFDPLVGGFLAALVASILLGAVMRWLSASIGAVVPPRPDRWHSQPTPTMGGVAIAGATIVAFVIGLTQLGAVDFGEPWGLTGVVYGRGGLGGVGLGVRAGALLGLGQSRERIPA